MIPIILGIFIFNLSANTLPWNTTIPINTSTNTSDISHFPTLVTQNLPWALPLLSFALMCIADYLLAIKRGVDIKNNLFAVAVAFSALMYVEVAGGLAGSAYAYLFGFLMILSVLIMTLFKSSLP